MLNDPNDLDDLFRQQLGQHATPPGADVQRRLAELAAAERLDARFRVGLGSYASPPRRALWERLEDEHLHPQPQRRVGAAWWSLSAAAVLLLALLVGGLGRGGYLGPRADLAARKPANRAGQAAGTSAPAGPAGRPAAGAQAVAKSNSTNTIAATPKKNQVNFSTQATAGRPASSSPSIATATRPRRAAPEPRVARRSQPPTRRPVAAAGALATGRPAGPALPPTPRAAPETPASPEAPALAAAAVPAAPAGIIEVDVRRGPAPAAPAVTVAAPGPPRRRLRLGGLLRQADHLVHGEPVSLTDATGPPQSLTVEASLGGRTLSKTIRL